MAACGGQRYVVVRSHNKRLDPSSVTDDYWVWVDNPADLGVTYGKWLVFGRKGSVLDSKWHKIHPLVNSGALGATGAKCSTGLSNGTSVDDGRGVICVYTTREMRDEVGSRLIEEVRQTRPSGTRVTRQLSQDSMLPVATRAFARKPCPGKSDTNTKL